MTRFLLSVLLAVRAAAQADEDVRQPEEGQYCVTLDVPAFPAVRSLDFCKQHGVDLTCCNPIADEEVAILFENFLDRGRSCPFGIRGSYRQKQDEFMQWMCLTCDPNQGRYLDGDGKMRVCKDYADRLYAGKGEVSNWAECGMRYPGMCGPTDENPTLDPAPFPDAERFECGDDVILPLLFWANSSHFLETENIRPYMLEDQEFIVVNEADLTEGQWCFSNAPVTLSTPLPALAAAASALAVAGWWC